MADGLGKGKEAEEAKPKRTRQREFLPLADWDLTPARSVAVLQGFMTSPANAVSLVKAALSVVVALSIVAIATAPRGV